MRYAIWISTPSAEDAEAIAAAAPAVATDHFDFAIRELESPEGPVSAVDLAFHVDSDAGAEDAKTQALKAYEHCCAAAGIALDEAPPARVVAWPTEN